MPRNLNNLGGTVPVPDPTKLTTDAVSFLKDQITETMDTRFRGMKELIDQKFIGVATEFSMRDIALAAAFKAAEAAVRQQNESNTLAIDKASVATAKQIDAMYEKINDLKERVTTMESRTAGITSAGVAHRETAMDSRGMIFGLAGIAVAILTLVIGYFRSLQHVI